MGLVVDSGGRDPFQKLRPAMKKAYGAGSSRMFTLKLRHPYFAVM